MKPGITGLWQVSGRSDIQDFEEVVKLDVTYIDHWSLALDLRILAKTVARRPAPHRRRVRKSPGRFFSLPYKTIQKRPAAGFPRQRPFLYHQLFFKRAGRRERPALYTSASACLGFDFGFLGGAGGGVGHKTGSGAPRGVSSAQGSSSTNGSAESKNGLFSIKK